MATTLELEPEVEAGLRELAEAAGLSVEGYLVTVLESVVERRTAATGRGPLPLLRKLLSIKRKEQAPHTKAVETVSRMKAELLAHKERAVEAVTRANLLRKTIEKQQAVIAAKELQALRHWRDGAKDLALRRFQESCVYGENLRWTWAQCESAATEAATLVSAFRQKEERVSSRISRTQAAVLGSIESEFAKFQLAEEVMDQRISGLADSQGWDNRFDAWIMELAESEDSPPNLASIEFAEVSLAPEDAERTDQEFLAWEIEQNPAATKDAKT